MFAGCWDKDIWSWDKESKLPGRRYKGHSDFVKTILCATIGGKDVGIPIQSLRRFITDNRSASYPAVQMQKL